MMPFEVPVGEVEPSRRRVAPAVAAVAVLLAVVAGIAVVGRGPADAARTAGTAPASTLPSELATPARSPVPLMLRCVDVDPATCARMARIAIEALPSGLPAAIEAAVWKSMLCGDTPDCPPGFLDGGPPLGSVILRFEDGSPGAAVNIVDGQRGPIRRSPKAWVVYWLPADS
jgi:hypothetical protein